MSVFIGDQECLTIDNKSEVVVIKLVIWCFLKGINRMSMDFISNMDFIFQLNISNLQTIIHLRTTQKNTI